MFRFDIVFRYSHVFLSGLKITGIITGIAISGGLALAVVVATLRLSKNLITSKFAAGYIEFFRCTPVLCQLIWFVFALPILIQRDIPPFVGAILAVSLNGSAAYGEQIRAGIQAVPVEQLNAAIALGLSRMQRFRYIVLPQAVRTVIPLLLTTSVGLLKDSSLVSTVAVADLLYEGRLLAAIIYRPIEIFTLVGAIYFCIAFPATVLVRLLERKLQLKIGR